MTDQEILTIRWEDYGKDIEELIENIRDDIIRGKKFSKIVAIVRGGLIPSDYLARKLGIKYVETLCVSSYTADNTKETDLRVIPNNKEVDPRKDWLIVDDLVDSGDTMELAKKLYPNSKVATLYVKPGSPRPDYFVRDVGDVWVRFPWE